MKKFCAFIALTITGLCLFAQSPGQPTTGPGNLGGVLYASSFAQWTVPQGNTGAYSWNNPSFCRAFPAGFSLNPVFKVGTPVKIVDTGNPAQTEIVTVTAFNTNVAGCSITVNPTYQHLTFYLTSGSAGLQEAINFAGSLLYQVYVTPDWTRLGGQTSMLTAATGNANVSITDARSSVIIPYTWTGSAYVASPFSGGGNTTSTGLTSTRLPKANNPNSIVDSLFADNGSAGSYLGSAGFSAAGLQDTLRPVVDTFTVPAPGATCGSGTDSFAQLCQLGVNAENVYTGSIFRATGCTGTTVTGSVSPFAPYLTAIPFTGTYVDTIIKLNPGCVFTVPGELDIPTGGDIDGQTTYAYYGTPRTGTWLEAASNFPFAPTSSAAGNVFINLGDLSSASSETFSAFNRLHDVGVDCMGLPWSTGIEQGQSQQGSTIHDTNVRNCTYNLNVDNLGNGAGGAQNHGPIHDNAFNIDWPGTSMGVTAVVVTAGGSSYTSAPTVTITGCATNPAAVASLSGNAVSTVTIVNTGGNGYGTSCSPGAVSVAFSGGGGSGATATAVIQAPPPNISMRLGGIHGSGGGIYWTNSNVGSSYSINRATGVTLDNSGETMLDTYVESAETAMCVGCHTSNFVDGDLVAGLRAQGSNEPMQTVLQIGSTANSTNVAGLAAFNLGGSEVHNWIADNNVNGGVCRNDISNNTGVTAYMRDGTKVFSMCRGIATTGMIFANPYYNCGSCTTANEPRQYLPGKLVGGYVQSMSLSDTAQPVGVGANGAFDTSNAHRSAFSYAGLVSVVLDPSEAVTVGDLIGISSNTVVSGQNIAGGVDMQTATFPVSGYAGWLLGTVVGYSGTDGAIAIPSAPSVSGATLTPSTSGSITYSYQVTVATGYDKTESPPSATLSTTTGPNSLIANQNIRISGLTSGVYNVYRTALGSSSLPSLTLVMAGEQLAQITGLSTTTGYTWAFTATFSGGGCTTEPAVLFYVSGGVDTDYTITNPGSGCTGTPTMTLAKSSCETGWVGQINSTTAFTDFGFCGDGTTPPASGILAPLVRIDIQYNGIPGTGNVNGPASSTANDVASFNGTSGTAIKDAGVSALNLTTDVAPLWLQYLGTGADGAYTLTTGTDAEAGEKYYTTFNVSSGAVLTVSSALVVHATGACTVNGLILANGATNTLAAGGIGGGSSGGSGGGAAGGTIGKSSYWSAAQSGSTLVNGGSAGTSSGGNGTAGGSPSISSQRAIAASGLGVDGVLLSGSGSVAGANSGGGAVEGGGGVTLICASITGTGAIDVAGAPGIPPTASSEGGSSGAGGGVVLLSSQAPETFGITVDAGAGAGQSSTAGSLPVPIALIAGTASTASGNQCTTPPILTLGVSGGALNSCTVTVAGAGCGASPVVNWSVLGGGGTGGTITPTWSGGAVASCTASGGSGYTAATYTAAGAGANGGIGFFAEFSGW